MDHKVLTETIDRYVMFVKDDLKRMLRAEMKKFLTNPYKEKSINISEEVATMENAIITAVKEASKDFMDDITMTGGLHVTGTAQSEEAKDIPLMVKG